jgi:hypothetical protein
LPAEANALADFESANFGSGGCDGADDFVAGNKGVLADAPIVGDQMQVAMADSAVGDGNFNVIQPKFAWVVTEGEKFSTCCMSCKALNLSHNYPEALFLIEIVPGNDPKAPVCRRRNLKFNRTSL